MNQNRDKICERMEQILYEYNVDFAKVEEGNYINLLLCEPYEGKIVISKNTVELYVDLMPVNGLVALLSMARKEFRLVPDWSFERMIFLKEDNSLEEQLAKAIDHVLIDNKKLTRVKHVDYTELEIYVCLTRNRD